MQELIKKSKNISYRETLTDKKANIIVNILSNSKSSAYIKSLIGEYKNCNKTEAIAAGFFSCEEIIGKTDAELGWKRSANTLVLNDRIVINGKVPMAVSEKGVFNRKLLEALTKKFPTFDNNNITSILGITNPKYNNESDLIYFHKIVTFIDCVYYGVLMVGVG